MLKLWFVYFVLVLMLLFSVWQVVKYPVGLSRVWKCPQQIDTTTARMAHNYNEAAYGFCGWNFSFPLSLLLYCKYSHIFRGKNSFFGFRKQLHFLCNYMEHTTEKRWDSGGGCMHSSSSQVGFIWKKTTKKRNHEPFRFVLCICLCHSFCRLSISLSCSHTRSHTRFRVKWTLGISLEIYMRIHECAPVRML